MFYIKNGMVHDGVHREGFPGDILVEDGKIKAIRKHMEEGHSMEVPAGAEIVDAEGLQVYPGFVEAHGHIGLDGYGIGYEGMDYNELNDIISPQMRGIDGVKPMDPALPKAAAAGVTCVCVGPGSANVLGGTFFAVKTVGDCVDDMILRDPVAMKCVFGENPKRCYRDKGNSARMSTAAKLRETLFAARDYMERKDAAGDDIQKRPKFDLKMESLIPVLRDICTAIRIAREFGLKLTLEHCTEGHLIPEVVARSGCPVAVGPTLTHASKLELAHKSFETPGVLARAGCQVSIITDSSVIPQQYLSLCAGLAVKAGMDPFAALQAITINPAKHLGVADRVGSLEVGKDADLVLTDGDPMVSDTTVKAVFINGRQVVG